MAEQAEAAPPAADTDEVQLTQVRVPIADAADAFSIPDESGRFPIVVLTGERSRVRNELVLAGLALLAVAILFGPNLAVQGALIAIGGALVVLGVFQSFIVRIPEGAQALGLRRGRFERILPAGVHVLPPWIAVSHVITKREIPFVATGLAIPTSDDVRVDVQVLITFTIEAADRFIFSISAPDFDTVCAAASQDSLRRLLRGIPSDHVLDLAGTESETLRTAIGADLEPYGVVVHAVVLMSIVPPAAYMASLEARRIAEVQRAELVERHALAKRLQADRLELERSEAEARRKLLEIEAANEAYRLEQLQARLAAYPKAASWDFDSQRMDVARAMAGNDRALLAVGDPAKLTESLLLSGSAEDGAPEPGTPAPSRPRRRAKATGEPDSTS